METPSAPTTAAPSPDELADRQHRLDTVMAAFTQALAADGGTLVVHRTDVATGQAWVTMAGACGSCAVAEASTQEGMRRILADRLDWFRELHVVVEDSDVTGSGGWTPRR